MHEKINAAMHVYARRVATYRMLGFLVELQ